MPAFIVTLAGMFLARGGASVITQDSVPINHDFYAHDLRPLSSACPAAAG